MDKKLLKLSLIFLAIGLVFFLLTYFCFHYVTDEGFTTTWQPEAGKPFVTLYLGVFATIMTSAAAISALTAITIFKKEKENE